MSERKHSHYYKDVSALTTIDVYRVLQLWEVDDPCLQHAIKKLLVAGGRGAKDARRDIGEAIDSLTRWIEMRDEEEAVGLWRATAEIVTSNGAFTGPIPPGPQPWEREGRGLNNGGVLIDAPKPS